MFSCPGATKFILDFDPRCETERRWVHVLGFLLFFSTNLSQSVIVRYDLHVSCSFNLFTFAFSTSLSQSVTVRYDLHVSCSFDLFTFAFSTSFSQSVTVRYVLHVSCSFKPVHICIFCCANSLLCLNSFRHFSVENRYFCLNAHTHFFFLLCSQLCLWDSPFWVRILQM